MQRWLVYKALNRNSGKISDKRLLAGCRQFLFVVSEKMKISNNKAYLHSIPDRLAKR